MNPSRSSYDVVVVGGGVIGLYTAYHLASQMDAQKILIVDRGFPSGGASGRNGGGIRQQWETRATIRLAKESVSHYRGFSREFGFNPWFRQGGYLFLSYSEEENRILRRMEAAVRKEDLPIRWMDPGQAGRIVPELNVEGVKGGTYLPRDGVILPFPVIWGLYSRLKEMGVEMLFRTEVRGFGITDGKVRSVVTSGGTVAAPKVVNAAGGWSRDINALAGLESSTFPTLHEILATEPVNPFLTPMVVTLQRGVYFSQTMRGEVVGGLTLNHASHGPGMSSSTGFLVEMAAALARLVPSLSSVRILRSWAGFYDDTPDGMPVLGEDGRLRGFFHANGFGGHGFMLAPSTTRRVAQMLLGENPDIDTELVSPQRFAANQGGRTVERLSVG